MSTYIPINTMQYLHHYFLFILLISAGTVCRSQSLSITDRRQLLSQEQELKIYSDSMINAATAQARFRADSNLVKGLVRALKVRNSFFHPFDSLKTVSRLYAPDSSFRIFTWQLKKDDYVFLQKGAIQMNTTDGSLKLFPLFDYSMFTAKATDSVRTNTNWIGSIYYKIIQKEYRGVNYYTLLGFDDYSISSNKKWLEVLTFKNNKPAFGGYFISFKNDTLKKPAQARFSLEYKKEASALLTYDSELGILVFDHLISESEEPGKKNTYIPDGTYEGFKWEKGQWVHLDEVNNFSLANSPSQVENLRDAQGNINEQKLEESSRKNREKQKSKPE